MSNHPRDERQGGNQIYQLEHVRFIHEEEEYPFLIIDMDEEAKMKNINPFILPHFHGLPKEYQDTSLIEFEVLYMTYYKIDSQKLRLFPSTLKDTELRWFMGIEGVNIKY